MLLDLISNRGLSYYVRTENIRSANPRKDPKTLLRRVRTILISNSVSSFCSHVVCKCVDPTLRSWKAISKH